jgi:hypothetical protein
VLDGRAIAAAWQEELAAEAAEFRRQAGRPPGLGVIMVGGRPDSFLYVHRKQEACHKVLCTPQGTVWQVACHQVPGAPAAAAALPGSSPAGIPTAAATTATAADGEPLGRPPCLLLPSPFALD